ncbi:CCA tRNA nucleotidyltransferase [Staphylococcus massiliensis]|uniref:CCA tRNA nucleotidyltransferase n=1 Tax=Staphylococcus massiliensis TaxID=555791 RepID=UPI00370DE102
MMKKAFNDARPILDTIEQHGYEAYFVGGAVRDFILERPINDVDITTSATPDEIETIFERTIPIGKEHGTINVLYDDDQYEVTTYRTESDYVDHRRPDHVAFVRELKEDLKRRDFTINALAMDKDFQVVDYFEGKKDMRLRQIRAVGEPAERFTEDALRILRGVRFQSQLDFEIETHTFRGMAAQIHDIKYLSIERIVVELKKLFHGVAVEKTLKSMNHLGAFNDIPVFKSFDMKRLKLSTPLSMDFVLAILKLQQGSVQLKPLKISNQELQTIQTYEKAIAQINAIQSKFDIDKLLFQIDIQCIYSIISKTDILKENDVLHVSPFIFNKQVVETRYAQLPITSFNDLAVNGHDLMTHLNQRGGPWIKATLNQIVDAILKRDIINDKDEILKWVTQHVEV